MKTLLSPKTSALILSLLVCCWIQAIAQQQNDVVVNMNGERMEGKVTGISPDVVRFQYAGEELEYELKKENIHKIEFANGRIQEFNELLSNTPGEIEKESMAVTSSSEDRHNKLAVLPFQFVTNDQAIDASGMQTRAQNTAAQYFREESATLQVQNPMQTNAILAKNNIEPTNIMAIEPAELANMLGVEYLVIGSIDVTNAGTVSGTSSSTSYKEKEKKSDNKDTREKKNEGTAYSSGSTYTSTNYDTRVDLNIMTDKGETMHSDSRHSLGNEMESFDASIHYMIKRTPFGSKYKGRK